MRFSGRTPADLLPNRLAGAVAAARAAGAALIDLTDSNPTAVDLPYPWPAIDAALAAAGAGRYLPDPRGLSGARAAVAGWYAARGVVVDPAYIVLTASTSEAYALLFKLLCDPGDHVLVPRPSYPLFDHLAAAEAIELRPYVWSGRLSAGAIDAALDPRTRAVITVSPNNPTGAILSAAELADLGALCAERQLAVIADEVFADYVFSGSAPSAVSGTLSPPAAGAGSGTLSPPAGGAGSGTLSPPAAGAGSGTLSPLAGGGQGGGPLSFALGGLSKTAGLPQLKLGWIAVAGPPAVRDEALARLELLADTFLSVATPVQLALPQLLELTAPVRAALRARIADNRARIGAAIAGLRGARLADAAGGWSAVIDLPGHVDADALATDLAVDDQVIVHPGWFFDLPPATLVLSTIVPPDRLTRGLAALLARLA